MTIQRSDRKAWAREHFKGLENVLMPSFSANLRDLDEDGIRLDVRQSIAHGFFSSLCAVESGLSLDEKKRMLSAAADEAQGKIGIAVSLTGESVEANVETLRLAEAVGATHAQLNFPQAFAPKSQEEVYDFVRQVADATDLGLYISDNFGFHQLHPSGLPFEAYERLAEVDNIVALKLGGMDPGLILEAFERFSDKLLVTTVNIGMLPMLSKSFDIQWSGAWTVEGLQSPEKPHAVEFFNHLTRGETEKAMASYWRMAPALGATMRVLAPLAPTGASHWPLQKYQQWLSGGNGGMTRQPVMRVYDRDMMAIRGGLKAVGVDCADANEDFYLGRSALAREGSGKKTSAKTKKEAAQ